jgi:hypothetical protein
MNLKRHFDSWLRGWIPKEPSPVSSGGQRTRVKSINSKIGAVSTRAMGGLGLGSLLSGFALLSAPCYLFPGSYTPKANSTWGYSEPATVEAWIILGAAIGLVFLSIFAFTLYGVKLKSQGSKWMKYTYWITPRQEDSYLERELLKITVATNLLIVGVFMGFVVYSAVTARSGEALFSVMLVFSVVIAIVNLVLHEFAKKKQSNKMGTNA